MESQPIFSLVFFPEINTAELKIPAHFSLPLSQYVTLRDRYGNTWLVIATKFEDHWYLQDGWVKFVSDSFVTIMNVLAFHYYGPGLLEVEITRQDGEIKAGVGYHKVYDPKEHEYIEIDTDASDDVYTTGRVSKVPRKSRNENYASTSKRHHKSGLASKRNKSYPGKSAIPFHKNQCDNKGKGILVEESSEMESGSSYGTSDSDEPTSEEETRSRVKDLKNKMKIKSRARSAKVSKGKKVRTSLRIDYLGKKLFDSEAIPAPRSKYYIVARQNPRRMNELYVPKELVEDDECQLLYEIELVDPDGDRYRSWKMKWRDGRTFYKGGWNKLGRRNRLKEYDLLICEFGEGDQSGLLFISIIRGAADILYGH